MKRYELLDLTTDYILKFLSEPACKFCELDGKCNADDGMSCSLRLAKYFNEEVEIETELSLKTLNDLYDLYLHHCNNTSCCECEFGCENSPMNCFYSFLKNMLEVKNETNK